MSDRIVRSGKMRRVVRVQALDPATGPTHAAERAGTRVPYRQRRITLGGVRGMGTRQRLRVHLGRGSPHAAGGLEPRHRAHEIRVHQPVAGGHRRTVGEQRRVPDHDRGTVDAPHDDVELCTGRATQQPGDASNIVDGRHPPIVPAGLRPPTYGVTGVVPVVGDAPGAVDPDVGLGAGVGGTGVSGVGPGSTAHACSPGRTML